MNYVKINNIVFIVEKDLFKDKEQIKAISQGKAKSFGKAINNGLGLRLNARYLRYWWLVVISLILASLGISFLVGYLLEPVEEVKY